jgi:hypothetical protein
MPFSAREGKVIATVNLDSAVAKAATSSVFSSFLVEGRVSWTAMVYQRPQHIHALARGSHLGARANRSPPTRLGLAVRTDRQEEGRHRKTTWEEKPKDEKTGEKKPDESNRKKNQREKPADEKPMKGKSRRRKPDPGSSESQTFEAAIWPQPPKIPLGEAENRPGLIKKVPAKLSR